MSTEMIKRISDEHARIDSYRFNLGSATFFNARQYKEDLEWLTLSSFSNLLRAAGRDAPEFAQKLRPPEPDFQTYVDTRTLFRRIELTEVLRPGYRRGEFHRSLEMSGRKFWQIPEPHPQPWLSFLHVLRRKLAKSSGADEWLVIYHDMPASEFSDYMPWHDRVLSELKTWTQESSFTCDITRSRYDSIYVMDSGCVGMVRLYPHWDIVRESAGFS